LFYRLLAETTLELMPFDIVRAFSEVLSNVGGLISRKESVKMNGPLVLIADDVLNLNKRESCVHE
jgi:hypothetical protein